MGMWLVVLKAATSVSGMIMCLSLIPSIYRVCTNKDTSEVVVLPLVALWISCHLWLIYGYVTNDVFLLLVTYLVGEVLAACYVAVHFHYTKSRAYTAKAVVFALTFATLGTTYAVLGREGLTNQRLSAVENIVGWITAAGSFILYMSPFEIIKSVLQTKSGASIPITTCTAGFISNVLWIV
ncbi:MtN3-like protein [Phytophthora cinnamomi]|uniref:MtN3-like protein n=1 Tax=Phytophthora cinnamomi TaxID=4785 RepID=UPI0035598718|nr:MtN3-like protein [Phytophthora cinnamomi]